MLTDLQGIPLSRLVDLLAYHTERYTQLLADKQFDAEYEQIKKVIHRLQLAIEIKRREWKKEKSNPTSDPLP